ncbi:MAG TPA: aminopeptidase, partial [Candidatus Binatia bacterium]|nr:aminopeptidase [Candidatus Binatia bacterium]
ASKTVSWVPLAGWLVPDEQQRMRIQLKVAIIDVRSGSWTVLAPRSYGDKAVSTRFSRSSSDQRQVESLKKLAYEATARELITQYSR